MTKLPSLPVMASRFEPVSSPVTTTVAPGTTAPVASFTVPVIWPVAVCASQGAGHAASSASSGAEHCSIFLMVESPLKTSSPGPD